MKNLSKSKVRSSTLSKKVLARDSNTCQCCGLLGTEVHHINPVYKGGLATENNLITLCRVCHKEAPNNKEEFLDYQKKGGARLIKIIPKLIKWAKENEPNMSLIKFESFVLNFRLKIFEQAYSGLPFTDEKSDD